MTRYPRLIRFIHVNPYAYDTLKLPSIHCATKLDASRTTRCASPRLTAGGLGLQTTNENTLSLPGIN